MKFQDIHRFFQERKPTFLCPEAAVGYVVSVLVKTDACGTDLIQQIEKEYPGYCLSDTVLYQAIKFLKSEQWVKCYTQKLEGRGRPHRMLSLNPEVREEAQGLAQLWQDYVESLVRVP